MKILNLTKLLAVLTLTAILSACGGGDSGEVLNTSPTQTSTITPSGTTTTSTIPANIESIGTGKLQTRTFVVNSSVSIQFDSAGRIIIPMTPANLYQVGDVLIIDNSSARLAKIVSRSESSGNYVYEITDASLAEAFSELDIKMAGDLGPNDLGQTVVTNDPEIDVSWISGSNTTATPTSIIGNPTSITRKLNASVETQQNVLQITYKNVGAQIGSGISISGDASFKVNPDFSLKLAKDPSGGLPNLNMTALVSPEFRSTISLTSKFGGQISYTLDKTIPLKPFRRIILIPVGPIVIPVPFWIQPNIVISASAQGSAGSQAKVERNTSISGAFGFKREGTNGYEKISTISSSSGVVVDDAGAELSFSVVAPKVEIQFYIYSAAGPFFDMGLEGEIKGTQDVQGTPAMEGVLVTADIDDVANAGLKGGVDFKGIKALSAFFKDLSVEYTAVSIELYRVNKLAFKKFFPYSGVASITIRDNGNVPDDIFEVSLDGTVLGRTTKGGSGQFRLKSLKPGERILSIKTVEDDSPPGTYEIVLADGLTFKGGGTSTSGGLDLNSTQNFTVVVPAASP